MWKFLSRGLRETVERNVRGGLHKERNVSGCDPGQQKTCFLRKAAPADQIQPSVYHSGFRGTSSGSDDQEGSKQRKRKSTAYHSKCEGWFGAFRCSSFLALGWVLSHPCVWRKLCHLNDRHSPSWGNSPNLLNILSKSVLANPIAEDAVALNDQGSFSVQLCSDVVEGPPSSSSQTSISPSSSSLSRKETLDKAADDFKSVHNSILAEVENRQGVDLISVNSIEALRLFASATKRGYAPAAFNMAQCYELGVGTKQDFHEAALWYQRAVDLGHPTAMYNLGVFYAHGWGGLEPSNRKARLLFRRAARKGQPEAMSALGISNTSEEPLEIDSESEESDPMPESDADAFSNFQPSDSYKLSPYSVEEDAFVPRLTQQLYSIASDLASAEARTRVAALDAANFLSDFFLPGAKIQENCIEHEIPGCCVE